MAKDPMVAMRRRLREGLLEFGLISKEPGAHSEAIEVITNQMVNEFSEQMKQMADY